MEIIVQLLGGATSTALFHPITLAKILIQLGYEPLPPKPTTNLFGKTSLVYPNTFKYLGHIHEVDGFRGLYRGLGLHLVANFVSSYVTSSVYTALILPIKPETDEEESTISPVVNEEPCSQPENGFTTLYKDTSNDVLSRSVGIVVSHPFYVIFIRSASQFIGREEQYDSLLSSFSLLWKTDGLSGFFAGLVPRLLGEVLAIVFSNVLTYVINNVVLDTSPLQDRELRGYSGKFSNWVASQMMHPFAVVSVVMAVNGCSGLAVGRAYGYDGWMACWASLSSLNQLKRGSSLFWRKCNGPSLLLNSNAVLESVAHRAQI